MYVKQSEIVKTNLNHIKNCKTTNLNHIKNIKYISKQQTNKNYIEYV